MQVSDEQLGGALRDIAAAYPEAAAVIRAYTQGARETVRALEERLERAEPLFEMIRTITDPERQHTRYHAEEGLSWRKRMATAEENRTKVEERLVAAMEDRNAIYREMVTTWSKPVGVALGISILGLLSQIWPGVIEAFLATQGAAGVLP